jgi:hypothetical protein
MVDILGFCQSWVFRIEIIVDKISTERRQNDFFIRPTQEIARVF